MGFDKESEMTILDEFIPVIENTFIDQPMSTEELPTFAESKDKLPKPIWDITKITLTAIGEPGNLLLKI